MEKITINGTQKVCTLEGITFAPDIYQNIKEKNERRLYAHLKRREPVLDVKIEAKVTLYALQSGKDNSIDFKDYMQQVLLNKLFDVIHHYGFLNDDFFYVDSIAFNEDFDTYKDAGIVMLDVSTKVYDKK